MEKPGFPFHENRIKYKRTKQHDILGVLSQTCQRVSGLVVIPFSWTAGWTRCGVDFRIRTFLFPERQAGPDVVWTSESEQQFRALPCIHSCSLNLSLSLCKTGKRHGIVVKLNKKYKEQSTVVLFSLLQIQNGLKQPVMITVILISLTPPWIPFFMKGNQYLKPGALIPGLALCPALGHSHLLGSDERIYEQLLLQETAAWGSWSLWLGIWPTVGKAMHNPLFSLDTISTPALLLPGVSFLTRLGT